LTMRLARSCGVSSVSTRSTSPAQRRIRLLITRRWPASRRGWPAFCHRILLPAARRSG
jgi:hypothetical protein